MTIKSLVPIAFAASLLGSPSELLAQRPTGRAVAPQQAPTHEHTARQQMFDGATRALAAHASLLRRLSTDHQFADQFEDAADKGDLRAAAALASQATGVPADQMQVTRAPATMGARSEEREFRVEHASLRTRSGGRSFKTYMSTQTVCLLVFCITYSVTRTSY